MRGLEGCVMVLTRWDVVLADFRSSAHLSTQITYTKLKRLKFSVNLKNMLLRVYVRAEGLEILS